MNLILYILIQEKTDENDNPTTGGTNAILVLLLFPAVLEKHSWLSSTESKEHWYLEPSEHLEVEEVVVDSRSYWQGLHILKDTMVDTGLGILDEVALVALEVPVVLVGPAVLV